MIPFSLGDCQYHGKGWAAAAGAVAGRQAGEPGFLPAFVWAGRGVGPPLLLALPGEAPGHSQTQPHTSCSPVALGDTAHSKEHLLG